MHADLLKISGALIGYLASWKIIFLIFNPSEVFTIMVFSILLFIPYGIHTVEWAMDRSFSMFGKKIYENRKVMQQYRLLGIIPISYAKLVEEKSSFLMDLDPYIVLPAVKIGLSLLPFGALLTSSGKLKLPLNK